MKKFVFSRYLLVCRKQFADDWHRQMGFTAVMSLLLFFIYWIMNGQINMINGAAMENELQTSTNVLLFSWVKIAVFVGIVLLAIGYQSAHSMPFMKSKTLQIAHLVLPATTMEKYLAAETFAFVFSIMEAVVAFFVADALQYFLTDRFTIADIASLSSSDAMDMILASTSSVTGNLFTLFVCVAVASLFFHSAWFTFCATLFRKHPFLFGILVMWGVNQVIGVSATTLTMDFMNNMFSSMQDASADMIAMKMKTLLYVAVFGQLLLAVGFWIWSYFRMKRVEL